MSQNFQYDYINEPRVQGLTPLGSDWQSPAGKQMYSDYTNMYNTFMDNGRDDLATQLTRDMEVNYPIAGGTQPMLNKYSSYLQGLNQTPVNTLPNQVAIQPTNTGSGNNGSIFKTLAPYAGPVGMAASAGLSIYDMIQQAEAQKVQQQRIDEAKNRQKLYESMYLPEVMNDTARRNTYLRGVVGTDPTYQAAIQRGAEVNQTQHNQLRDDLQRRDLNNSGILAMADSNNANSLHKNMALASTRGAQAQNPAYRQLSRTAQGYAPQSAQIAMANNRENDFNKYNRNTDNAYSAAGKSFLTGLVNNWQQDQMKGYTG